jgi:hypothetical protein
MKRETITANYLKTICWFDNSIIDWGNGGKQYLYGGGKNNWVMTLIHLEMALLFRPMDNIHSYMKGLEPRGYY